MKREDLTKAESRHGSLLQDETRLTRDLFSSKGARTGKSDIRIYRTWEIIPDEMHFGIIAWPSTILRPDRLWRSWGPALRVWSRCSTRDCLSWVVKNRISSSLPSKQLASEPTNSLNPPPNSCRKDFGRCTSSAALSRLRANRVTSIRLPSFVYNFLKCTLYQRWPNGRLRTLRRSMWQREVHNTTVVM